MSQTPNIPPNFLEKIMRADHLPSLPAVSIQVLQLSRKDDTSVIDMAKAIEQDPALTAKILKMVNSSLFSLPKKIASLPQAMVILGLRTVKVMALSFSLVNKFDEETQQGFNYDQFWKRSITTAVSSRLLAEKYDKSMNDEAFISGLLCDLGIIAAIQCGRQHYQPILDEAAKLRHPLQEVEAKKLGITHAHITAHLLRHWGLPDEVVEAVEHHHDLLPPSTELDDHQLNRIVWAAAMISDLFCAETPSAQLNETLNQIATTLDPRKSPEYQIQSKTDIESILSIINQHVKETADQIAVRIGQTTSFEELRLLAMSQLAQMSVTAELDRAAASKMADTAQKQIDTLNHEKKKLAQDALTDALTQLGNRKAFDLLLARTVQNAFKSGDPVGLVMLDLDHFKKLNDTYGHPFGDEALKIIGQTLKKVENDSHLIARYGGEEFAVICTQSTLHELKEFSEHVRRELERIQLTYGTKIIRITASLGAAHADPTQSKFTLESLLQSADKNLLKAKQEGRNQCHISVLK